MFHSRRTVLALMLSGAVASPALSQSMNPWAPRRLNPSERDHMHRFLRRVSLSVPEISRLAEFRNDHVVISLPEDLLFRSRTAELSVDGVRLLTLIAEVMMAVRVRMEAVSHHHSDGQSYRSFIISQRRAVAITAAMESRQIPRSHLLATGLGGNFPIATNSTEIGRSQNRRTDLIFRPV